MMYNVAMTRGVEVPYKTNTRSIQILITLSNMKYIMQTKEDRKKIEKEKEFNPYRKQSIFSKTL